MSGAARTVLSEESTADEHLIAIKISPCKLL
jgi:hypothetical protein